ncbi:hypothetical protein E2C01_065141 [Portunus trituberculatus]|uniref:Uncharacterized protein n=1 Tax=Portunus trituberculatus TaxID=210409 RepID=A0A5B7HM81_PORTR|nr:hypothetical protein [Portunus trituberculatus]
MKDFPIAHHPSVATRFAMLKFYTLQRILTAGRRTFSPLTRKLNATDHQKGFRVHPAVSVEMRSKVRVSQKMALTPVFAQTLTPSNLNPRGNGTRGKDPISTSHHPVSLTWCRAPVTALSVPPRHQVRRERTW